VTLPDNHHSNNTCYCMTFTMLVFSESSESAETEAGGGEGSQLSGYGLTNNDEVDQFAEALVGSKPLCQAT